MYVQGKLYDQTNQKKVNDSRKTSEKYKDHTISEV